MPTAHLASTLQAASAPAASHTIDYSTLAHEAISLAAELLRESRIHISPDDHAHAEKMDRLMKDPDGKAFTFALADQVFRARSSMRSADQFSYLLAKYGIPQFLTFSERQLLRAGATWAHVAPCVVMPSVTKNLRKQSARVVLPAEPALLHAHLARRRAHGTRLNLNQLGEAILSEEEANRRLEANLKLLASPDVEYISVKISAIFSQLNILAFEDTVAEIQKRLRTLYNAALCHTYTQPDGTRTPKFVNLDMEEYRDLHLTATAFQRTLMEPEFLALRAGIVLQAYLPDSSAMQHELTTWARARVAAGGAPIKLRIVKGANLAMERIDAANHGWPQAPYHSKADVDANYIRMVNYGCRPENAPVVNIGVATHNLFDAAYALLLRRARGVEKHVEFEMLEGMANHQAAAVQRAAQGLLLYAPIVAKDEFHSAIAYLIRRLDENTADENFLHDLFGLEVNSPSWGKQSTWFLHSVPRAEIIPSSPNRIQNRLNEKRTSTHCPAFGNEPDTDWTLKANREWIYTAIAKRRMTAPEHIPLQIAGEFIGADKENTTLAVAHGRDPSRPKTTAYTYTLADQPQVEGAIAAAHAALETWSKTPPAERRALLLNCVDMLAQHRDELITAALLDGGKAASETDPEVSEAIDFANYYARAYDDGTRYECAKPTPLGVVTIAPPWNFPVAIPCGGILAALMAGNTVIFKPASETTLCGWRLANILWKAGVPKHVLQFVTPAQPCASKLITDTRIAAVVLTGSSETAERFLGWRPGLRLFAETGGKNAMIVTAAADHDQAVKDVLKSAFGHNGQKCSAASLLILEGEVYDNPAFIKQLREAAASLRLGSAWHTANIVTPLIHAPDATLQRALTTLDQGEEWVLEPRMLDGNPCLWSPGIKRGVKPGSWFHQTECFGPVLGIMRARDLADAIKIANSVKYGLTSGLHSLDDRKIALWRDKIEAGNLYINRHITGAIVRRQPFGGWKASVYGPGAKAGGPNYVAQFSTWETTLARGLPKHTALPSMETHQLLAILKTWLGEYNAMLLDAAAGHYAYALKTEFSVEHDPSQVLGEHNQFRYRLQHGVLIRANASTDKSDIALALLAARTAKIATTLSVAENPATPLPQLPGVRVLIESDATLAKRLENQEDETHADNIFRELCAVSDGVLRAVNTRHMARIPGRPVINGHLELRALYREQAISNSHHRYGNIIPDSLRTSLDTQ